MDKRKTDDDSPKRWRMFYVGVAVLVILLVFTVVLNLITPKMGVFDSVIDGMTQTMDAASTISPTPNP